MTGTNQDWTRFYRRIYIDSTVSKIYNSWSQKQELETWFLRTAEFYKDEKNLRGLAENAQAGDRFHWEWHNWEGASKGLVLEANGKDRFAFEFAEGTVRIELTEGRDKVLLKLIQYDIPTDDKSRMQYYVGCSNGWTFWLANLKAYLEHGILLNDKGPDLQIEDNGMDFVNI
jgi:uncharacterized protein YndB with AHSA1/START domain